MELNQYTPKGDLKGLPIEVIKQMLIEQVAQGNKEDVTVFERDRCAKKNEGGFDWYNTKLKEGWINVITHNHFTDFYKMYPKEKPYPKMMWVWNYVEDEGSPDFQLIDGEYKGKFMQEITLFKGKYIAWNFAKDIEEND